MLAEDDGMHGFVIEWFEVEVGFEIGVLCVQSNTFICLSFLILVGNFLALFPFLAS